MTIAHPAPTPPTDRVARALDLHRDHGQEIRDLGENTFEVPSCTGRQVYRVRYGGEVEESCSCPDHAYHPDRDRACKHLLAVGITHARRRSGVKVIAVIAVAAGDPFKAAARNRSGNLAALEERLAHENMGDEERCELEDHALRLRRRLGL